MLDDLLQLRARARRAIDRGDLDEADALLLEAATETHVDEQDYASVLEPLAVVRERRGDARGALAVRWYLARRGVPSWDDCLALLPRVAGEDRGRTLAAMGKPGDAAREMEAAGRLVAAATHLERAEDWRGAGALWSRLSRSMPTGPGAYEAALVQGNLARCALRCSETRASHEALVRAVHLLEEAADHFEAVGLRERAFDCFQVLIQLGREHRSFEDVVEGFVNCIRILREDHLTVHALRFLDDAIASARAADELTAAATLAREASHYARTVGAADASARYVGLEAELWRDAAHQHLSRGDPPETAENALLSAVVAFGETGQIGRVGSLYTELGALELREARRVHYAQAACRYAWTWEDTAPEIEAPARAAEQARIPEVWHVDLLEWEQAGSAAECCAELVLGESTPPLTRRLALLGRLTALDLEGRPEDAGQDHVAAQVRLADLLSQMQSYAVLSPLERLWRSRHRAVRLAVLSGLQRLLFKRSFVTVRAALHDPDPDVVDHAAATIEALDFAHAFEPLSRLLRESSSPRARLSAIKALAHIDTGEAAELLLGVLEHGSPADREAAARSLREAPRPSFVALAGASLASRSPAMQAVLRQIVGDGQSALER